MRAILIGLTLCLVAGCGEDENEIAKEIAWEEGYNAGQYDVCREVAAISMPLKNRLDNCRGH